jgi:HEAT repeat protein
MSDKISRYKLFIHTHLIHCLNLKFYYDFAQAVKIIAQQLASPDVDVRARSVGCVHNLSADAASLGLLREAGCLPAVVALLRDSSPELCRAAAGIVQNTAREEAARLILEEAGAVALLLDLLTSSDVECQVRTRTIIVVQLYSSMIFN